ncbi:hypothetical protein K493DRAFT_29217 [Basidiobolus meristosporus CBS 931.73]|uniref:Uncharacterized protein n=1 Tax=Basidiobolus meristosporus CBS 931.73 TaxID=1314790 RepID=A0A1Y1ZEQ8_9FUNG|nr:hypothetical protein K493DRAFT_29217 [Basidiobolus meristosporus CBS 931.73]|eukprot:ORY08305.1 hypothetical protein K493DRAFT_29217 [Basidiobolus meristosporus CBS 931.73]
MARPELNNFPIFFTLLEPFEEMKYLTTRPDKALPPPLILDQPFADANHAVVFVSDRTDNHPIIVTFSKSTRKHYIWTYSKISQTTDEKVPYVPNKKSRRESSLELERVWSGEPEQTSALSYCYTAQMKSPISLQLLWSEPSASQADNVFISHDLRGNEVLCFLFKATKTLYGFDIAYSQNNLGKSKQVLKTEGIAAIPIKAIRKDLVDILVLKPNSTLQLQVAGQVELECTLSTKILDVAKPPEMPHTPSRSHPIFSSTPCSDSDMDMDMDMSMDISHDMSFDENPTLFRDPGNVHVVDIQDQVSSRVNLMLSDSSVVRVALDFIPKSMLVRRCLKALSCALPIDTYSTFLAHYLTLQYGNMQAVMTNGIHSLLICFISVKQNFPLEHLLKSAQSSQILLVTQNRTRRMTGSFCLARSITRGSTKISKHIWVILVYPFYRSTNILGFMRNPEDCTLLIQWYPAFRTYSHKCFLLFT